MTAWEIVDATLKASGLPDAATIHAQGGYDCVLDFETRHFLNGFGHKDGRFRFKPDWSALGPGYERMPGMPDHMAVIDEATASIRSGWSRPRPDPSLIQASPRLPFRENGNAYPWRSSIRKTALASALSTEIACG